MGEASSFLTEALCGRSLPVPTELEGVVLAALSGDNVLLNAGGVIGIDKVGPGTLADDATCSSPGGRPSLVDDAT